MIIPLDRSSTGIEYGRGDIYHTTKDVNDTITRKFNSHELKELEPGKPFGDLYDPTSGMLFTYDGEPGKGRWSIYGENHSGLDPTDPAFDSKTKRYSHDKYDEANGIL
ncbi:MAG TPA: hypothetical protein VJ654_03320 [Noviherbaspirillum sp.]|nr:hypothetical protein [Noviherbaspirillum sp.]